MKNKIKSLKQLSSICNKLRKENKTIGLITGCFDILHLGHTSLFLKAKKHIDILIVGVDNDKSIKLSKSLMKPINKQKDRLHLLSYIELIDYIFPIKDVFKYNSKESKLTHSKIFNTIKPNALITSSNKDELFNEKFNESKIYNFKLINLYLKNNYSTSKVIQKIRNNNNK